MLTLLFNSLPYKSHCFGTNRLAMAFFEMYDRELFKKLLTLCNLFARKFFWNGNIKKITHETNDGPLRCTHIDEGGYKATEATIQTLLAE
jgi:hypothetical protein